MSGNSADTVVSSPPNTFPRTVIPHGHVRNDLFQRRLLSRHALVLLISSVAQLVPEVAGLCAGEQFGVGHGGKSIEGGLGGAPAVSLSLEDRVVRPQRSADNNGERGDGDGGGR